MIIGDDVVPEATLVKEHLVFHDTHPGEQYALLGQVYFPEALEPNCFHALAGERRQEIFL